MLGGGGGGDTSASVLGGGGTDGNVAASSAMVSGGGAVVAANMFDSNGNNSNNSGDDERVRVDEAVERSFEGNRWPRQETLALLKIRSDMDVTFRDASVKGPLWEEVSRKLAELGYHRSAKKCREKFENVYKYHKRTKDGRTGKKSEGKIYRFSDHLQVLESHHSIQSPPTAAPQVKPHQAQPQTTMAAANPQTPSLPINVIVPSATLPNLPQSIVPPTNINPTIPSFPNVSADLMSYPTSSSTSSDSGLEDRKKRKRKWKGFFEKLMKEVVQEQEEMQKKFLEALEKREHERMVREEAWRMQEIARINRERELLAQERSMAAAKDSALMALLQKLSDQKNPVQPQSKPPPPPPDQQQQHPPVTAAAPQPVPRAAMPVAAPLPPPVMNFEVTKRDNGDQSYTPSSSRWPKAEVQALIELRTSLDNKYHDSGTAKGPLWEEISAAMKRLGYNRNAKRCKEKWENINKYFKKVKDNQKQRPEDAKTCPYFHQLDALYREKNKQDSSNHSVPLMVRPEQQWPPPPPPSDQPYPHQRDRVMENPESDQNRDDDRDEEEEDEDEGGGDYEIVASRPVSMDT